MYFRLLQPFLCSFGFKFEALTCSYIPGVKVYALSSLSHCLVERSTPRIDIPS